MTDQDGETLEFIVYEFETGRILTNLDDIETAVDKHLEQYRGLDIAAEQAAEARKICADLTRIAIAISDWRIQKEQEFMKPFLPVKAQVRRITGKIEQVHDKVNEQLKKIEDAGKGETA